MRISKSVHEHVRYNNCDLIVLGMFEDFEFEEKVNPWDVKSIEAFRLYCCPECSTRNVHRSDFIRHALTFHPRSQVIFDKFEDNKDDIKPIVTEVTTSETIDTNVSNQPTSVSNNSATVSRNVSKDDDVTLETEKKGTVTLCYTSDDSSDSSDDEDTCNDTQVLQPTKELQQNISQPQTANTNNSSNLSNNKDLQENVPQSQNAFDYSILSTSEVQIQKLQESSINDPKTVNQAQPMTMQTLMSNTSGATSNPMNSILRYPAAHQVQPLTMQTLMTNSIQRQSDDQTISSVPAKRPRSDLGQSEVPPGYVLYPVSKATNHRLMTQPFMCEFCYQHFTTFNEAAIHLNLFHPQEVKMCGIITQSGIDQSITIHKCQDCHQVCIEVTKLRIHRWLQHSELN